MGKLAQSKLVCVNPSFNHFSHMLLSVEARGSCHGARLATAGPRARPESGGSG